MSSTGNDPKAQKMQKKKTNFALLAAVGVFALGALVYVAIRNRSAIAAGGAGAVRALGPIVSRVLPAVVLGILSMIAGPEGIILGVPVGLLFGPELISLATGGRISATSATAATLAGPAVGGLRGAGAVGSSAGALEGLGTEAALAAAV